MSIVTTTVTTTGARRSLNRPLDRVKFADNAAVPGPCPMAMSQPVINPLLPCVPGPSIPIKTEIIHPVTTPIVTTCSTVIPNGPVVGTSIVTTKVVPGVSVVV